MNLEEILSRRSDLSTFLVHLTRATESDAKSNLRNILTNKTIEARTIYGHLSAHSDKLGCHASNQKVVCFTETPIEFSYILTAQIDNRAFQFQPYGIAITKRIGRGIGINPVWYVDISPGHDWITNNLDRLRARYLANPEAEPDLGRIFPFVEHMGNGPSASEGEYFKEFWWEREWRHIGDFRLPSTLICLCPESEIQEFNQLLRDQSISGVSIDPRWSLEQIIAHLAGFQKWEISIRRNLASPSP